jgi:hypothetical protein
MNGLVTFMRSNAGFLATVSVRRNVLELRATYPYLLCLAVPYRAKETGLPYNGNAANHVYKIEDLINKMSHPTWMWVGHVASNGQMVIMYMSQTPTVEPFTLKTGFFKKETFQLAPPHEDAWAWYDLNAHPRETDTEYYKQMQIYFQLAAHGDNHAAERPVDFATVFPSVEQRSAFLAEIASLGFTPGQQGDLDPEADNYFCEVVKVTAIDFEVMTPLVEELLQIVVKHGGSYDGWGCPVAQ